MKLIRAEEACARANQIVEEENKRRRAEAEVYIDTHVAPEIKKQVANGCHYTTLCCYEFVSLDFETRRMVCSILNDYHYEAYLDCDATMLKISWYNKSQTPTKGSQKRRFFWYKK